MLQFEDYMNSSELLKDRIKLMRATTLEDPKVRDLVTRVNKLNKGRLALDNDKSLRIITNMNNKVEDKDIDKEPESMIQILMDRPQLMENYYVDFTRFAGKKVKQEQVDIENLFIEELLKKGANRLALAHIRKEIRKLNTFGKVFGRVPIEQLIEQVIKDSFM